MFVSLSSDWLFFSIQETMSLVDVYKTVDFLVLLSPPYIYRSIVSLFSRLLVYSISIYGPILCNIVRFERSSIILSRYVSRTVTRSSLRQYRSSSCANFVTSSLRVSDIRNRIEDECNLTCFLNSSEDIILTESYLIPNTRFLSSSNAVLKRKEKNNLI